MACPRGGVLRSSAKQWSPDTWRPASRPEPLFSKAFCTITAIYETCDFPCLSSWTEPTPVSLRGKAQQLPGGGQTHKDSRTQLTRADATHTQHTQKQHTRVQVTETREADATTHVHYSTAAHRCTRTQVTHAQLTYRDNTHPDTHLTRACRHKTQTQTQAPHSHTHRMQKHEQYADAPRTQTRRRDRTQTRGVRGPASQQHGGGGGVPADRRLCPRSRRATQDPRGLAACTVGAEAAGCAVASTAKRVQRPGLHTQLHRGRGSPRPGTPDADAALAPAPGGRLPVTAPPRAQREAAGA